MIGSDLYGAIRRVVLSALEGSIGPLQNQDVQMLPGIAQGVKQWVNARSLKETERCSSRSWEAAG